MGLVQWRRYVRIGRNFRESRDFVWFYLFAFIVYRGYLINIYRMNGIQIFIVECYKYDNRGIYRIIRRWEKVNDFGSGVGVGFREGIIKFVWKDVQEFEGWSVRNVLS